MPNASDRFDVAALVGSTSADAHAEVATRLAAAVDQRMRALLVERGVQLVAPRRGRRDVVAAWLAALTAAQPELAMSKDPAAVALGRKGGLKGGRARAEKLTPEQRSEAARRAAQARWARE